MKTLESIAGDALALPVEARTELIRRLVLSLDDEAPDGDAEDALADVIAERIAAIEAGTATLIDGKAAVARIREELRRRR